MTETAKVYAAINAVQRELARVGIEKSQENSFDRYKFRGIDDVYAAVSPLLAEHKLCIIPRMLNRSVAEHTTNKGGMLFYVTIEAEFDFVSVDDGSKHTARTFGEAMDRGDKATNKAMSAAYKYACFLTFAIPVAGNQDADEASHQVRAVRNKPTDGAIITADRLGVCLQVVEAIKERMQADDVAGAFGEYDSLVDSDEKVFVWGKLDAPTRRQVKEYGIAIKANAA